MDLLHVSLACIALAQERKVIYHDDHGLKGFASIGPVLLDTVLRQSTHACKPQQPMLSMQAHRDR